MPTRPYYIPYYTPDSAEIFVPGHYSEREMMYEVGVEGGRFRPHPRIPECAAAGCVPVEEEDGLTRHNRESRQSDSGPVIWYEDGEGTVVIIPKSGRRYRVAVDPATHYAEPSKKVDGAIEIKPKEESNGPTK